MPGVSTPIVAKSALSRASRGRLADSRQRSFDWDEIHFQAQKLEPCRTVDLAANARGASGGSLSAARPRRPHRRDVSAAL